MPIDGARTARRHESAPVVRVPCLPILLAALLVIPIPSPARERSGYAAIEARAGLDPALTDRGVSRRVTIDSEPPRELRRTLGPLVPALVLALLSLVVLAFSIRRVRRENVRRRRAEQRLIGMTERLQTGVFQFVHERGKQIRLVFANPFFRSITNIGIDERGREHVDFVGHVAEEERGRIAGRLGHCLSTGETFRETFRYDFPDGTRGWVLAEADCRTEPDGARVWSGYLFDLTGERRAGEQLDTAMIARDAFVSMTSRVLRTPIRNVVSALELVGSEQRTEVRERLVDDARAAASDLELLIGDLVELDTLYHHEPTSSVERFDIAEQVREVCRSFERTARERGLAFRVDIDEGVPARCTGDRLRCRRILRDIVGNAFKYTDAGSIHVGVRTVGRDAQAPGDGVLEIAVSDTGIGIPAAQLARVFEPLAAVGNTSRSSGLGLALCDRLAASMGGHIDVTSDEGHGSRFTLTPPLRAKPPERASAGDGAGPVRPPAPAWNLDSDTVLVVDDDLVVRRMLAQMLENDGWRTRQAADGPAALELARQESLIAIVSDQHMPGMSGTELASRLREERIDGEPRPVMIMISGGMSHRDAAEAAGSFDAMLFKPVKAVQVRHAIASVTGSERVSRGAADEIERATVRQGEEHGHRSEKRPGDGSVVENRHEKTLGSA